MVRPLVRSLPLLRPHASSCAGPKSTREVANLLVHPSLMAEYEALGTVNGVDVNEKLDEMMAFYDNVNMEDIVACERVQVGVASKAYTGGRLSFRFEETIHRFQNMIIDHMCNNRRIPPGDETGVIGGQR